MMNDREKTYGDDKETIIKIKESLDFLDGSAKVEKPDLMKFVDMVNHIEEKRESGKNRQFIIFVLAALFIIAVETYSFYRSFAFFEAVQVIALIIAIPVAVLWVRNKKRQVSG